MNVRCPNCGATLAVEDLSAGMKVKCGNCAKLFLAPERATAEPNAAENARDLDLRSIASNIHEGFNKLTGLEKIEGFRLSELLSEIFRRHGKDEVEAYFTVGTAATTPPIEKVDTTWPRPWAFFRALGFSAAVFVLFNVGWHMSGNPNLLPGLMAMGTIAVPVSALIFFFESNVRRNVSLYILLRLVLMGGIASLLFSLALSWLPSMPTGFLGASCAGLVEEPAKLAALIIVASSPRHGYKLNGLLMGAAIGTGFAIFESMGYAFCGLLESESTNTMTNIIVMRGVLSPFAHIAWTAIAGAALWRVKGSRPFRFAMLASWRFWRLFALVVVMHMVWNSPLWLPFFMKYVILGAVAWIVILALMQEGLKELRREKQFAIDGTPPAEDEQAGDPLGWANVKAAALRAYGFGNRMMDAVPFLRDRDAKIAAWVLLAFTAAIVVGTAGLVLLMLLLAFA